MIKNIKSFYKEIRKASGRRHFNIQVLCNLMFHFVTKRLNMMSGVHNNSNLTR